MEKGRLDELEHLEGILFACFGSKAGTILQEWVFQQENDPKYTDTYTVKVIRKYFTDCRV